MWPRRPRAIPAASTPRSSVLGRRPVATSRWEPETSGGPSAQSTPTFTPSPSPTPTPALRQLTESGCCAQPAFSPDSSQILFIDKPAPNAPTGVYGVSLTGPLAPPTLVNETVGFRSPDQTIVATLAEDLVRLTDESSGQSWTLDTGG